ncbi:MOSC domain-containing protein [Paenibacillus tuaregi]|uniref:MOSC domain-containing protein n=1 Tax=Paenibacillus tuaregi TaxID=1816681 RepID=UPI000AC5C0E9|nr:MOSC domain-containing protein [Paenibacillus tuaregi]
MNQQFEIVSVNTGKVQPLMNHSKPANSAIVKQPTKEELFLSELNLQGDEQADLVFHGGVDKALCVYSFDHYPFWEKEFDIDLPLGAFGENLTVKGLTEEQVCIGDTFQWGEAVVQVSQPRRPCYKISARYNIPQFTLKVTNTGYTGFYLRVLKQGMVSAGEALVRLQRHDAGITIAEVNRITLHDKLDLEGAKRLVDLEILADSWRDSLAKRLKD